MTKVREVIRPEDIVTDNPWRELRQFTDARIGLGRCGISLPTAQMLQFQLAHARARDAVHSAVDFPRLAEQLMTVSQSFALLPAIAPLCLASAAGDRRTYLQRPDLGRTLDGPSRAQLQRFAATQAEPSDLAIVIADGLSAKAITVNAVPFLNNFCAALETERNCPRIAPLLLVNQARVAIADDIGALLNAKATLLLIGERPGLSSPDSLGLYLTYAPQVGLTDDRRNCISNVRKGGQSYHEAARKTLYLLREAKRLETSGVAIKDRSNDVVIDNSTASNSFLLASKL